MEEFCLDRLFPSRRLVFFLVCVESPEGTEPFPSRSPQTDGCRGDSTVQSHLSGFFFPPGSTFLPICGSAGIINGSASLNLEAELAAAAHAARAVTSALWEFNYGASQRAAHACATQISCTKQAINEHEEVAPQLTWISANTPSLSLYLSNQALKDVRFHLVLLHCSEEENKFPYCSAEFTSSEVCFDLRVTRQSKPLNSGEPFDSGTSRGTSRGIEGHFVSPFVDLLDTERRKRLEKAKTATTYPCMACSACGS